MFPAFSTQSCLKQGDVLSLFPFNFALETVIRNVQGNKGALELSGAHQLPVYGDDVNLLTEEINIKKNKDALLNAGKKVSLKVKAEQIK